MSKRAKQEQQAQDPIIPADEPQQTKEGEVVPLDGKPLFTGPFKTQDEAEAFLNEPTEEPKARYHGDPSHAQYLLTNGRQLEGIRYAAEHGWARFLDSLDRSGVESLGYEREWDDLDEVHRFGIFHAVASIVANPHQEPYAGIMPNNKDRKEYRALDDALRDALGYARFNHGE